MTRGDGGLRITGGEHRGRALFAPPGQVLRPMRSQVRMALFNVLGTDLDGQTVLDLFAGSGCLGIEALSRGAERAVFVERAKVCLGAIERNLGTLGLSERGQVRAHDLNLGVGALVGAGPFDLILVHPPFELLGRSVPSQSLNVATLLGSLVTTAGLLAPEGTIAFETPRGCYPDPERELPALEVWRRRDYGSTTLFLASARGAEAAAPADPA